MLGRILGGMVRVTMKKRMLASPSNSGRSHDTLAHVQVLLKWSGPTGGEGIPE